MPSPEQRLQQLYRDLDADDRDLLVAFAELLTRRRSANAEPVPAPAPVARPAQETVVGAIRRLRQSYHMVERDRVLHETSALMAEHMLQGRPAADVIDELEALFERHYRQLLEAQDTLP